MSPRKAAGEAKAEREYKCACEAIGFGLPNGAVSNRTCRCHCKVKVQGSVCGMCTQGIHGRMSTYDLPNNTGVRVAGFLGD